MNDLTVLQLLNGRCYGNQYLIDQNHVNWPTLPSFTALVFLNGLEDRNINGRINPGGDLSTSYRNLMRFRPCNVEFTRLKYVGLVLQQVSINIRVNSIRLLANDTATRGLHARLCYTFQYRESRDVIVTPLSTMGYTSIASVFG